MFDSMGTIGEWVGAIASALGVAISVWALNVSKQAESEARKLAAEANQASLAANEALRKQQEKQQVFEQERAQRQQQYDQWMLDNRKRQAQLEHSREKREDAAEARNIARSVTVWWAKSLDGEWGLRVSNDGRTAGTVFNVRIEVSAKAGDKHPLRFNMLPPGQFFAVSSSEWKSGASGWEYPVSVRDVEAYEAILNSKTFQIRSVEFADSLGKQWVWSPREGLQEASPRP